MIKGDTPESLLLLMLCRATGAKGFLRLYVDGHSAEFKNLRRSHRSLYALELWQYAEELSTPRNVGMRLAFQGI